MRWQNQLSGCLFTLGRPYECNASRSSLENRENAGAYRPAGWADGEILRDGNNVIYILPGNQAINLSKVRPVGILPKQR